MSQEIIQDYGKTVDPKVYINALQGHQYIPQADQCIKNIVQKFCARRPIDDRSVILDVGCGPGRLTPFLGQPNSYKIGIDLSESFIDYAWKNATDIHPNNLDAFLTYQRLDFGSSERINKTASGILMENADIIVMQGVMHHIHGDDRAKFLQRSFNLLNPDGILAIGDEFVRDYRTKKERQLNVCKFYLHIIDEARKGGFDELAEEEAKNLIDDCFSGTQYAGHGDEKVFEFIYEHAHSLNHQFYMRGSIGTAGGSDTDPNLWVQNFLNLLKTKIEQSSYTNKESFNRGDFKISAEKFIKEVETRSFTLKDAYKFGPVDELGGMGVLVFKKH